MVFDIIAIIFTITVVLIMKKKGGIKALLSLTGLVASICIAISVYPYLSKAVYNTPYPKMAEDAICNSIEAQYEKVSWEALDAMPEFIQNSISTYADTALTEGSVTIAQAITEVLVNVIIFVLVVILTKLLFALLSSVLKLAVKLPVIKQLNSLLGALCGFFISVTVIWLVTALLGVIGVSEPSVKEFIENSYVVMLMSNITLF